MEETSQEIVNEIQRKSIFNMIQLINECQTRGAFSLDEAGELFNAIKHFNKENKDVSSQEDQKKAIILFINALNKSQKQGILELEEAHLAWECFQAFTRKEEDNNIDSSV